uniref:L1 transposable element RRM domain-containing protein n=1 Tax=Equus caballus TaxID=9796 RepID=A0A9L0SGW0_HORSE
MCQQGINSSNTMKNYSNTAEEKKNDSSPETKLEVTEDYNLTGREFKIAVVKKLELQENSERQFNKLRNKINEQKEYFTKEINTLRKKKKQTEILEMKNTISKMKSNVESIKNIADHMEERISELEDRNLEMIHMEEERELRFFKNEEILQEISNSIRKSNIRIIVIPEGEERKRGLESLFKEIIAENFPNLGKELDVQIYETTRTPNCINAERSSPRHVILKLSKVNDKKC